MGLRPLKFVWPVDSMNIAHIERY